MRKFIPFLLVALLAAVWVASRWFWPAIDAVHPVRGQAVEAVYATGTVEATVMLPIASSITARLTDLRVDEGSTVTKGQLLARLNTQELQLTAPADGLIIRRDGEVGQLVPANQPVFWLSCCAPLRISAEVDEEDISRVKPGQEVLIRADAFPGEAFHGKIQAITPKGDPVSRSYRVRIEFTKETPLRIGMTVETNIIIGERKDALLVPTGAVTQEKVWLVKDGRLARQPVITGARGAELTEIKSGITMEEAVVLKPDSSLKEGQKARVKLVAPPTP